MGFSCTPHRYKPSKQPKVVLFFHGWGESGKSYLNNKSYKIKKHAERYNYVFVALDGLGSNSGPNTKYRSWTHP